MNKVTGIIIAVILVAFAGFLGVSIIEGKKNAIDVSKYDYNAIIEANEDNGGISDHVKGNPKAKVILFEYADYECPGCATFNPWVNKILKEYGDKIGLVYRSVILSYHHNSQAATAAAEAAGLQGHWEKYANLLFANQSTWQNIESSKRGEVFTDLFKAASEGKGDLKKFKADMVSKEVKKKVNFDRAISDKINVPGTPSFYLNGKKIELSGLTDEKKFMDHFKAKIDERLRELEQK